MLGSIFGKGLRDQRRALPAWLVAVAAYALLIAAFYPTVAQSMAAMQDIADKLPQAFRDAFIGSDMTSAAGWLDTKLLSIMAPIMFLVFAVGAGARSLAGEEEDGTLDLLLAQPVSRTKVALEKYAVLVTGVALLAAALWATLAVSAPIFDMHIGAERLLEACVSLGLLALAFGSLAFVVAAAGARRGTAAAVAGGLAGAMYLVNILAPDAGALRRLEPLSLFHYYGVAPLSDGLPASHAAVFAVTSLVCLGIALAAFGRRDIG